MPLISQDIAAIQSSFSLPTPEQQLLTNMVGIVTALNSDTAQYAAQAQQLNPLNAGSILLNVDSVRAQLTITSLVILLFVVFGLVIAIAQCFLRFRIEHEPPKTGFVEFSCSPLLLMLARLILLSV